MSATTHGEFREAVGRLHREKDAAYGHAWKKRGEVVSILANIARKIDRLEYVLAGAQTTRDETLLDTAVDLFVYTLKYQTYLADLDPELAGRLFGKSAVRQVYSDGPGGFEYVLSRLELPAFDDQRMTLTEAAARVITCFGDLEASFSGVNASHPVVVRHRAVEALTHATMCLIGALSREVPALYRDFLVSWRAGDRD